MKQLPVKCIMVHHTNAGQINESSPSAANSRGKGISVFLSREPLNDQHPSLIHFSSTPLFRLDKSKEKYKHLLKQKDVEHLSPLVNYFINQSGHVIYLGGDAVINLFLRGKKKYKSLTLLVILANDEVERYSNILNNIISSNDGAFSMGMKYKVSKNRKDSCFKELALARYIIEPRLEGPEKLLYPLRSSTIELDLSTHQRFSLAFEVERT